MMKQTPCFDYLLFNQHFFRTLPGKSKKHFFLHETKELVNKDAIWLWGVKQFFNITECPWDTLILSIEIWYYPAVEKILAEHPKLQNKNVFVITMGYSNYQFGNRCWKLSWPWLILKTFKTNLAADSKIKERGLAHGFGCLNGRTAVHRILLGYHLHQKNLLDQIIFVQHLHGTFDAELFDTFLPGFENYKKLLPILFEKETYMNDHGLEHLMYDKSYCNILTETETETDPYRQNQNIEIITEKSAKPFITKQIPLFLAGQGHLAYLKYLGFETMDDLTPPEYDQMRTLDKIYTIVDIVAKGRDYIEDYYFGHLREIQHNYKLAISGTVQDKIIADIQKLIVGS